MKKIIVSLVVAISLYTTNVQPSYAQYIVFDPTNLGQAIVDYAIQGYQLAKETITSYSTTIDATQQTLSTINDTILIPAADALTLISIMKSGDNVQNLILGSLGVDPLLVKNPELYLENKGLEVVKASLGDVSSGGGIYADSIVGSIINNQKFNYADISTKIKVINESSIPSIIQEKTCDDEMLSNLAREDVQVEGQPLDQAAYIERKKYFQDAFCKNAATDPATANALNQLNAARPGIARWDSWLAVTNGDNAYTKNVLTQQEINKKIAETVETAKTDLANGGGIKSLTVCVKRASTNIDGDPYADPSQAPCIQEEIKQAASVLLDTFKNSIAAPLQTAISSFGSGAGKLIGTAFKTINLVQGLSTSVNSLSGGNGGGSGGQTNISNTLTSTTPPQQDLRGNASAKATISNPPKKHLQTHLDSLIKLEDLNNKHIQSIAVYKTKLDAMQSCYITLNTYQEAAGGTEVTNADNYHRNQHSASDALRVRIEQELVKVQTAKNLITQTMAKIDASQSTEEILNTFNDYQNLVDAQALPGIAAGAQKEGEYVMYKMDVDQSDAMNGPLYNYKKICTDTIQRIETARNQSGGY